MLKQAQEKRKTELHKNFMNCDITVYCQQLDYGYEIRILGGQRSHVGAVTVADEQGDLQTIVLPGHKEDVITRQWAEQIWKLVRQPVSVLAGVHYDNLEKEQLMEVIRILDQLLETLKEKLWQVNSNYERQNIVKTYKRNIDIEIQ